MRREDYVRATGDARFTDAAIDARRRAHDAGRASTRCGRRCPNALRGAPSSPSPARSASCRCAIFDRSFAVTYLLQAVAIAIGLAGVAATFSAQTLARATEFGMLRHIGVLKRADRRASSRARGRCSASLGARRRRRARARDEPGADPRRQPAVVPLDDGHADAVAARSPRVGARAGRRVGRHGGRSRAAARSATTRCSAVREDW